LHTVVKGVGVAGCSRSVDVSCTYTIGIGSLEHVSLVSTCMVLYRNDPVSFTTSNSDTEDTAGA